MHRWDGRCCAVSDGLPASPMRQAFPVKWEPFSAIAVKSVTDCTEAPDLHRWDLGRRTSRDIVAAMETKLEELKNTATKMYDNYLIERKKTFQTRGDFAAFSKQQYTEMQAEHAWLNAKQEFEIELYNAYGRWEPVPPKL